MRRGVILKVAVWYMIAVMVVFGFVPRVEAGFVVSQAVPGAQSRAEDLGAIQKALETKMVSETLEKYGMAKADVQSRLDQMTDEQLHQLATNLDEVRVGGDGFGVLVAVLAIVILVLFILWLTKHQVVVK